MAERLRTIQVLVAIETNKGTYKQIVETEVTGITVVPVAHDFMVLNRAAKDAAKAWDFCE